MIYLLRIFQFIFSIHSLGAGRAFLPGPATKELCFCAAPCAAGTAVGWALNRVQGLGLAQLAKFAKFKILQIFGGLVLGCIKTNFCKKICVRQHFSSSTRFASFCTAAISKFSQKNRFEKTAIFVKFQEKNCKWRKICKILPNFKNFSLRIW